MTFEHNFTLLHCIFEVIMLAFEHTNVCNTTTQYNNTIEYRKGMLKWRTATRLNAILIGYVFFIEID